MEVLPLMRLNSKYVFSVFLIWTAYVFCNCANVPALQSLYNISDQVTVLENKTLKSTVYNSEQAWFVQFYSSWCGHCLHFAPVWKAFAVDISGKFGRFIIFFVMLSTLAQESGSLFNIGLITVDCDETDDMLKESHIFY